MDIANTIRNARVRYVTEQGSYPDVVYLGRQEHDALCVASKEVLDIASECVDENKRPEFDGMKLYKVDADNFISFGERDLGV